MLVSARTRCKVRKTCSANSSLPRAALSEIHSRMLVIMSVSSSRVCSIAQTELLPISAQPQISGRYSNSQSPESFWGQQHIFCTFNEGTSRESETQISEVRTRNTSNSGASISCTCRCVAAGESSKIDSKTPGMLEGSA